MKTTATVFTVKQAIDKVNKKQGYKIEFNRADQSGKWFNFTLKSRSGIPGARTSWSGRNLACASWHAHGYIFDEIFTIDPDCVIWSNGEKMESKYDNWKDKNIGLIAQPCQFSETSIL